MSPLEELLAALKAENLLIERYMRGSISDADYCLLYPPAEQAARLAEIRLQIEYRANSARVQLPQPAYDR